MATRLKTVHYAFPALASLTNNTLTNLTQITVYLPETGTKTFRSVVAHVSFDDIITATGGTLTTKTLNLRLGAAGYTSVANANTISNSGENLSLMLSADYTSHFTTNWSGTSMTCDFQVQINQSTGTTQGMVNVCVTLEITYEYDDTSTTQVKTVMIPLDMPATTLPTSATTYDTMPALDTYLPEASKTYRNIHIVVQGNTNINGSTTDNTLTLRAGSASVTTGNYEAALASDRWFRYVWELTSAWPSTGATQTWQPTSSVATRFHHLQAYLVVTYEFNESTSTSIMNSVLLPMALDSPMGGTTSSDYQRSDRWLDIEEPGTIVTNRVAFFIHWTQIAAIAGLNMRVGTGSFVAYTDVAAMVCGSNGAMIRNDSAFTLARGRNTLNCDVYRTDTADFGFNMSGFWLVNYTSDKSSDGSGSHNHTVMWGLSQNGTAAAASLVSIAATAPVIPETEYYVTALGARLIVVPATAPPGGLVLQVERLSAEGGVAWESVYLDVQQSDAEIGVFFAYAQMRTLFDRWTGDAGVGRMDLETARRWRIVAVGQSAAVTCWFSLSITVTYHSILGEVAGTISGSSGGTVNINLHDRDSGEVLRTGSRTGNGAYSIPFFGSTRNVFTTARESSTLLGRSDDTTPTLV